MKKNVILETGLSWKKAGTSKKPVSAFTLVELIVVITILAILWTIAIMAFGGYSKNARDSAKMADIGNMKKSLELWVLQSGMYPEPTMPTNITYSWATVWTQWTYWDTVHQTVWKLDKKPIDPLYITEYTYSVTNSKKEYQIGAVLEWQLATIGPINQTYAATETKQAYVSGNYNGVVTSTQTGALYYILAVPSIIRSDVNDADILWINEFVLHKKSNLPHSYANKNLTMTGIEVNFTPTVVWSGTWYANLNDQTSFQTLVTNLQTAYSDPLFSTLPEYIDIISSNEETAKNAVKGIIETSTKQELTKVTTTETTPTNSYVSCIEQNNPTPFAATTTYPWCNTADIIVCSWSWTWYTIAACNVWSSTGSTDWTVSGGKYFQWGRNKGFVYGDATQQATTIPWYEWLNPSDSYWFVWSWSLLSPYYWANTDITNNWWGTSGTNEQRQGPCESGYHVPKQTEWSWIVMAWQWWTDGANMQTVLKLPYAGIRNWNSGSFSNGGSSAHYWSSSPYFNSGYFLMFISSGINPSNFSNHSNGLSVRCFKN